MKRIAVFIIALTCLVGAADFGHAATATSNLTVTATVSGVCTITTTPVSFGIVSSASPTTAQGAVTVQCVTGVPYTVTLNKGGAATGTTRAMSVAGLVAVNYELFKDTGLTQIWGDSGFAGTYGFGTGSTGTGSGIGQTIGVFGRAQALASTAPGNYTDIVVATINF